MTRVTRTLVLFGLSLALGGCVEISSDDDGGGGGTNGTDGGGDGDGGADGGAGNGDPPSQADIDACQGACDDLLFFDCLDADTHAQCYAICAERTPTDIDLFTACTTNTLPECGGCYDNLVDADPPSSGDDGADSGSVGGGSCVDACASWLGAGCPAFGEFSSCTEFCDSLTPALQDAVVECVDLSDGCTLPAECTFDSGAGEG